MAEKLLKRGARGLEVARVQAMLNAHGASHLNPDGVFGSKTEAAVRKFQEQNKLEVDGVVGPRTRAKLNPFREATAVGVLASQGAGSLLPPVPHFQLPPPVPHFQLPQPVPRPQGGTAIPSGRGWIWQVQPGGQALWTPWAVGTDPSSTTTWSGTVSVGLTYRTAKDGFHIEHGPLAQAAINSRSSASDPLLTFTGAYQVTLADIFAPGSFHLLSPFAQGGFFVNALPGSFGLGLTVGNQMSYEFIEDRFSIFVQPALAASWNLTTGAFTVGPQVGVGVTIQVPGW
jgi:hypothetical protein